MPKSKHRPPHRKEKKVHLPQSANTPIAGTPLAASPAGQPKVMPSAAAARSPLLTATGAARHPYVSGELKRIAILTVIILAILIILAFALPRFA